jgi:thiol-disulfide isomerase/thioredoxin
MAISMKKLIGTLVCCFLLAPGLLCCDNPPPTSHAVAAIDLKMLDNMVSDKNFRGLVVAMASWCPPCRKEMPVLAEIWRDYHDKGIRIVAISLDSDGPKAVQPLVDKLKLPFPVFWIGPAAIKHLKIVGIPTMLIYKDGRLLKTIPGGLPRKSIEEQIKFLLQS